MPGRAGVVRATEVSPLHNMAAGRQPVLMVRLADGCIRAAPVCLGLSERGGWGLSVSGCGAIFLRAAIFSPESLVGKRKSLTFALANKG